MLISYFGKKRGEKFEKVNIDYPDIASIAKEKNPFFNQVLSNIKKDKGWGIAMFNPISEELQKKAVKKYGNGQCG